MKQYYKNGPEGMPRVERMSDSTIDWVINGVNTDGMLVASERAHQQLRDVCHAVAEEVLARVSWPARIPLGTFKVERCDILPADVAELRDAQGKVLGRITNITLPANEDYMLEFRSAGSDTWHPSPHPRRPKAEAEAYAKEANARDRSVVYRAVPWDGK